MSQLGKEIRIYRKEPLRVPIEVPSPIPIEPDYVPEEKPVVPVEEPVNG